MTIRIPLVASVLELLLGTTTVAAQTTGEILDAQQGWRRAVGLRRRSWSAAACGPAPGVVSRTPC
jgi:hypothetical protein